MSAFAATRDKGTDVRRALAIGLFIGMTGFSRVVHPEDGRSLYLRYCAACHGDDARGHGRVAPTLVTAPPDLTRIAARRGGTYPSSEIAAFIDGRRDIRAHGGSDMPVWGTLLRQEFDDKGDPERTAVGVVDSIARYLGTIQEHEK